MNKLSVSLAFNVCITNRCLLKTNCVACEFFNHKSGFCKFDVEEFPQAPYDIYANISNDENLLAAIIVKECKKYYECINDCAYYDGNHCRANRWIGHTARGFFLED